ncbi:alkaline-phosphatase-like protein [Leucosporidium creatinivorum]|uniref:Alkaline phosphatase n=1 Tax=Leucosporidium creatinivorum TaxID=106004 RepID=A0A1Y2FTT9_9BASI|nr:alkaline-phosphatase-like protein [Leucosporidium creatinivorum]
MSRSPQAIELDPVQFVLDEETASNSSHTESLLGRHSPSSSDEKQSTSAAGAASNRPRILIPTRDMIAAAAGRRREAPSHVKTVVVGLLGLLALAYGVTSLLSLGSRFGGAPSVRVILMISDGMGPASETMSREFLQYLHDTRSVDGGSLLNGSVWATLAGGFERDGFGLTPLDEMLVGASRTRSSNSLVTDSAAGATAFSCGIKTYNGAIGVEPAEKKPCGTVLEAARRQGFLTGLVSTSRITHATPASFYAHVVDRDLESEIASFLVGTGPRGPSVDIALGGGECFFLPNSTKGSCRTDGEDMLAKAEELDVTLLRGMNDLRAWHDGDGHEGGRVLGLFARDHMSYEIDRQQNSVLENEQPSLKEMASHALQYLENASAGGKGFFLMVEGSRIDMAGHNNDPVGHLSDMLAYHEAVRFVKEWVDKSNEEGTPCVLISVSDHETGGLSLGRQLTTKYPEYAWYPDALLNATHSTEHLGALVAANSSATRDWLRSEIYGRGLGITDVTEKEIDELWPHRKTAYWSNRVLADAISRRAQIGWSSAGHSGVDVNLYAYGFNASGIAGNRENTEIGSYIEHAMGLNLDVVTMELNKDLAWHSTSAGKSPQTTQRRTEVKHYHGDF